MSTNLVESKGFEEVRVLPPTQPLNEAAWRAWLQKGRASDRRSRFAQVKTVAWVSIAALIVAAGLWPHLTMTHGVMVRFIVTFGAIVVMLHAFRARDYASAAEFGTLALLYNPVAPVFNFSGEWQRALVVASTIPFFASVVWRRKSPNIRPKAMNSQMKRSIDRDIESWEGEGGATPALQGVSAASDERHGESS